MQARRCTARLETTKHSKLQFAARNRGVPEVREAPEFPDVQLVITPHRGLGSQQPMRASTIAELASTTTTAWHERRATLIDVTAPRSITSPRVPGSGHIRKASARPGPNWPIALKARNGSAIPGLKHVSVDAWRPAPTASCNSPVLDKARCTNFGPRYSCALQRSFRGGVFERSLV